MREETEIRNEINKLVEEIKHLHEDVVRVPGFKASRDGRGALFTFTWGDPDAHIYISPDEVLIIRDWLARIVYEKE